MQGEVLLLLLAKRAFESGSAVLQCVSKCSEMSENILQKELELNRISVQRKHSNIYGW